MTPDVKSLCSDLGRVGETFRGGHRPGDTTSFGSYVGVGRSKRIQQINWFAQSTLVACGSQTLSHRNALPPEFQATAQKPKDRIPRSSEPPIRIRLFQRLGTLKTRISSPRLWGPETHQRPKAHQILPALVNAIMSYNVNKSKFQPSWSTIMKTSAIWVRHCQNALLVFLDLFLTICSLSMTRVILSQTQEGQEKPPAQLTDVTRPKFLELCSFSRDSARPMASFSWSPFGFFGKCFIMFHIYYSRLMDAQKLFSKTWLKCFLYTDVGQDFKIMPPWSSLCAIKNECLFVEGKTRSRFTVCYARLALPSSRSLQRRSPQAIPRFRIQRSLQRSFPKAISFHASQSITLVRRSRLAPSTELPPSYFQTISTLSTPSALVQS